MHLWFFVPAIKVDHVIGYGFRIKYRISCPHNLIVDIFCLKKPVFSFKFHIVL